MAAGFSTLAPLTGDELAEGVFGLLAMMPLIQGLVFGRGNVVAIGWRFERCLIACTAEYGTYWLRVCNSVDIE